MQQTVCCYVPYISVDLYGDVIDGQFRRWTTTYDILCCQAAKPVSIVHIDGLIGRW